MPVSPHGDPRKVQSYDDQEQSWQAARTLAIRTYYVFVGRAGTPHDHRNVAGRVLSRAVNGAGLEAVKRDGRVLEHAPTFHNLRRSHGSALIAAGWDIEEVSARLGHANVATTMRAYVHEYEAARRSDDRRKRLAMLDAPTEPTEATVATLPVRPAQQ